MTPQPVLFSVRQADGGIWETTVDSTTPKHLCSEACPGTNHRQKHPYRVIRGAKGDLARRHLGVTQAGLRYLGGSLEVEDHACSMRLQSWGEPNVAPGPYPAVAAFKNKVLLACSPRSFMYYLWLFIVRWLRGIAAQPIED